MLLTVTPLVVLLNDCINNSHICKPPPLRLPHRLWLAALGCKTRGKESVCAQNVFAHFYEICMLHTHLRAGR